MLKLLFDDGNGLKSPKEYNFDTEKDAKKSLQSILNMQQKGWSFVEIDDS